MTTEILRSMLYRGSEVVRQLSLVVYDEIHYLRWVLLAADTPGSSCQLCCVVCVLCDGRPPGPCHCKERQLLLSTTHSRSDKERGVGWENPSPWPSLLYY